MVATIKEILSAALTLFILGFFAWGAYTYIATMIDPPVSRHNPYTVDSTYDRGP